MERRGLFLVFLTALISGVSIFINAFGVKGINPFLFTGAKNLLVGLMLLAVIFFIGSFGELRNLKKKHWGQLLLIGLIGGSIPFLLFFKGLQMASAAQGSFIHKTMFLFVAVLAIIFLKERFEWKYALGAVLLLLGNVLLLSFTGFDLSIGLLLILSATVFWAAEITFAKHVLKDLSGGVVAFGRMFFGAVFISIFLLATGQIGLAASVSGLQLEWIIVTSLFLLGYVWTFYNGLKLASPVKAAAILTLGAPITTVLQIMFLGKEISVEVGWGIVSIAAGVLVFTGFAQKIYASIISLLRSPGES